MSKCECLVDHPGAGHVTQGSTPCERQAFEEVELVLGQPQLGKRWVCQSCASYWRAPIRHAVEMAKNRLFAKHGREPEAALVGRANYAALEKEMRPVLFYAFPAGVGAITESYVAQYLNLKSVRFVDWTDDIVLVNPGKKPRHDGDVSRYLVEEAARGLSRVRGMRTEDRFGEIVPREWTDPIADLIIALRGER